MAATDKVSRKPQLIGEFGCTLITGSIPVQASNFSCSYWYKLLALGSVTLDSGSICAGQDGASLAGLALTDHTELLGIYTAIQLQSGSAGKLMAYKSDSVVVFRP